MTHTNPPTSGFFFSKSALGREFKYGVSADLGLRLWDNERSRWHLKARGVWMPPGHVDGFLAVVQDEWLETACTSSRT